MILKNMALKSAVVFAAVACILSNGVSVAHAQNLSDEVAAAYEWAEDVESGITEMSDFTGEPVWTLREDKNVSLDNGKTLNLKSYTMLLLNDTRLCKGVTVHDSYFKGYVRARFETIFGGVHEGSDSGRVESYYGSTALTPDSDAGGWNGIAHTYCGSLSTR